MTRTLHVFTTATLTAITYLSTAAIAGEVEVLHWWTSGSEARSVQELQKIMRVHGHTWRDFAVVGGGGGNAMSLLHSRVDSGNPPAAAQVVGPAIQEWAAEGVLTNLDPVARTEQWDSLLPKVVSDLMKYKGQYVAVPVNVHRVNWVWANVSVLNQSGVAAMPRSWDEFFVAAEKIRRAGFVPVAMGGNSWNHFTTFETVAMSVGGTRFYRDAFLKFDNKALTGSTMQRVLDTFRRLKDYTDANAVNRDWNSATGMVIQGKAGFQFMGDWAKGEFLAAGKTPGRDFLCTPPPGNAHNYSFMVDSFIAFKLKDASAQKAQSDLMAAIMGKDFQEVFNLNKGSIPVRLNMPMNRFDDCAVASAAAFKETARSGSLLPSISQNMYLRPEASDRLGEIINRYWNDNRVSTKQAMQELSNFNSERPKRAILP